MFCYDRLLWKIHSYGFKKLCQSVGIKLPRLISVVDGEDGFTLKEIERISEELDISASDKEAYFFTTKVARKQLYDK